MTKRNVPVCVSGARLISNLNDKIPICLKPEPKRRQRHTLGSYSAILRKLAKHTDLTPESIKEYLAKDKDIYSDIRKQQWNTTKQETYYTYSKCLAIETYETL
jgi:hypothetical protein